MTHVKIRVDFNYHGNISKWNIKVEKTTTVAMLIVKLRRFAKLKPCEGIFLFWQNPNAILHKETIYGACKTMGEIQSELCMTELICSMRLENCFGAWNRGFLSAKIEKKKDLFVTKIRWSWYGVSYFEEMEVFETLEEAKTHILKERCAGGLSMDL